MAGLLFLPTRLEPFSATLRIDPGTEWVLIGTLWQKTAPSTART